MTCKPPLYALAALLIGATAAASQAPERSPDDPPGVPCGACARAAVRLAGWSPVEGNSLVLVLRPEEAIGAGQALVKGARTILLQPAGGASMDEMSFRVHRSLADLRGANPDAALGVVAPRPLVEALLARELAAYADIVVFEDGADARAEEVKRTHPGLAVWSTIAFDSFERLLEATTKRSPAVDRMVTWPPLASPTPELAADLRTLAEVFPDNLVPIADFPARCDPVDACSVAAYERADTRAPVVVIRRTGEGRASVVLSAPRAEMFAIVSHVRASAEIADSVLPLAPVPADSTGAIRLWMPMTGVSHLIARLPPAQERVAETVSVVGARSLAVEEIVARHQSAAARQTRAVRRLITEAQTIVTFEVPAFPAPVTIEADTTIFQGDGPTELAQRRLTVNGVAFASGGSGVPKLPLIEPERAASPPLAITLGRAYRYRLEGRERVAGRDAYVVAFMPSDASRSLFAGRAWIDADGFALLRVDAAQTNLRGPITSSQQIEEFAPHPAGEDTVWLLSRSEIRQVYQGAGITTPIHRLMVVRRHEINPPGLAARRQAAYASSAVMLRETPEGLRYLRRGDGRGTGGAPSAAREIAGRATRIRTLAGGVLIDPNISQPLPFAGLNYTDFDFLRTGTQLNAFYAGSYGQFAFNAPSIAGTRWQLTGSGFGILARYNDRSFRAGRERYEENLRQRPARVRAGVVRPLTARTAMRGEYLFDYVALERGPSTAPSFVTPADQVVHGALLTLETQRAGWRLEGWWNSARRSGWRAWGRPDTDDYREEHADFQRFGVNASRLWMLSPRLLARVEAAWMSGRDLDRFSRYAFGSFDNRLRGYPSASIRYDRGAALRTALAWQAGGRLRLDGFGDLGWVRDPGFGSRARAYPGIGAALEAPGPWSLLLGAEWGYGIRGLNTDGSRGTHVVRLTAYKVF